MSSPENRRAQELDEWKQQEVQVLDYEKLMPGVQLSVPTLSRLVARNDKTVAKTMRHVVDFASAMPINPGEIEDKDGTAILDFVARLCINAQDSQYSYDSRVERASKGGKARAEQFKEQRRESSDSEPSSDSSPDTPDDTSRYASL